MLKVPLFPNHLIKQSISQLSIKWTSMFPVLKAHNVYYMQETLYYKGICGVAQWLGCRSLAGGLSLILARSTVDM